MRIIRFMAQLIDILVCLGALMISYLGVLPVLFRFVGSAAVAGVLVLIIGVGLAVLMQLPFLRGNQTVGKAFFGLEIQSADAARPMTLSVLVQRELFCKMMSCYLICIPMLFGRPGGHEEATQTRVARKAKNGN